MVSTIYDAADGMVRRRYRLRQQVLVNIIDLVSSLVRDKMIFPEMQPFHCPLPKAAADADAKTRVAQ